MTVLIAGVRHPTSAVGEAEYEELDLNLAGDEGALLLMYAWWWSFGNAPTVDSTLGAAVWGRTDRLHEGDNVGAWAIAGENEDMAEIMADRGTFFAEAVEETMEVFGTSTGATMVRRVQTLWRPIPHSLVIARNLFVGFVGETSGFDHGFRLAYEKVALSKLDALSLLARRR